MNATVLRIELPDETARSGGGFVVRVQLQFDSSVEWHVVEAQPFALGDERTALLDGSREFYERVGGEHVIVRRVCRLVGEALDRGPVHLPQMVAA